MTGRGGIDHLDFDPNPRVVGSPSSLLSNLLIESKIPQRAFAAIWSAYGSIAELCEATPLDLLMLEGVGPLSVFSLQYVLATRGAGLKLASPFVPAGDGES